MPNFLRNLNRLEMLLYGLIMMTGFLFVVAAYDDSVAEKFSLRKDEWTCTEHKDEIYPMMIGKIVTMQHSDICINWKKKNG